jgi:hypothetical protein
MVYNKATHQSWEDLLLSLDDEQLFIIRTAAQPLQARHRGEFLKRVAHALEREPIIGAGTVSKVARSIQKDMLGNNPGHEWASGNSRRRTGPLAPGATNADIEGSKV